MVKYRYIAFILSCMCWANASEEEGSQGKKEQMTQKPSRGEDMTADKPSDQNQKGPLVLKLYVRGSKSEQPFDDKNPSKYRHPDQDNFYELEKRNLFAEAFYQ